MSARRIEDYALLGDCGAAALVSRGGSVEWLCLPGYGDDAVFAALLGDDTHGRWNLAPVTPARSVTRRYRGDSLVLETVHTTDEGKVVVVDCMPLAGEAPSLLRRVQGIEGRVRVASVMNPGREYGRGGVTFDLRDGAARAAVRGGSIRVIGGVSPRVDRGEVADVFAVEAGQTVDFELAWCPPQGEPAPRDVGASIEFTARSWEGWASRSAYEGPWRDAVVRSLLTVKALADASSGGIAAAATTSLPEAPGGARNWDYRLCWLRDATFTLYALIGAGYHAEADAWREWLVRVASREPGVLGAVYTVKGRRCPRERELSWLPGFNGARPARAGNGAGGQVQLDVYGEVLDALHQCRRVGLPLGDPSWTLERRLVESLESRWREPDHGIWEVRGEPRLYTYSRVMAWAGVDRAIKSAERFGLGAPLTRWRALRGEIHDSVCREGYDAEVGAFVMAYGSKQLDASLLRVPLVGFLPPEDPRVRSTVAAVREGLSREGFVMRYAPGPEVDGMSGVEGAFLPCTLWLADALALDGRCDEARACFERVAAVRNDVGLLAEEYDPAAGRLLGNFPQAISHVALVNTAVNLSRPSGPAEHRRRS
ncbi:MAG: glycoside hydrolase family 15 protein [Polyangiales bacterium]